MTPEQQADQHLQHVARHPTDPLQLVYLELPAEDCPLLLIDRHVEELRPYTSKSWLIPESLLQAHEEATKQANATADAIIAYVAATGQEEIL